MNNLIHLSLLLAACVQVALIPAPKAISTPVEVQSYASLPWYLKDPEDLTLTQMLELCLVIDTSNGLECDPDGDISNGEIDRVGPSQQGDN